MVGVVAPRHHLASMVKRSLWRRVSVFFILVLLAHLLDRWGYRHLGVAGVLEHDGGRMLRSMGYLPLWMALALGLSLVHTPGREKANRRTASRLIASPALGGLVAELLKILLRRERPGLTDGAYVFRPFVEGFWHGSGLGLPSSHASVAFAGATILALAFPRSGVVWYLLAAGTAWTRVAGRAHFISDVVVGAIVGHIIARMLWNTVEWQRGSSSPGPR